jgi:hyaluronoglucosaminidase
MSAFEHRGVVEGYYGEVLEPSDRLWLVESIGRWGMNRYVYAPKDDPLHRDRWREAYSTEALDHFRELVSVGQRSGVEVGFALSPGLSIKYSDRWDVEALIEKFAGFRALGARFFCLALDDVPSSLAHEEDRRAFQSLAEAHVSLAVRLLHELGNDITLWLVPTDYSGCDSSEYLETLGMGLPESIEVGWTGRTVVSPTITADEAGRRAKALGRRLLIWDNVPVNDGPMRPMLHLGPYRGRDPGLPEHVSGFLLNPMELPRASAITLHTAANYLADPSSYRPDEAWINAIAEAGRGAPKAFELFAAAHCFSPLAPGDRDCELEEAFDDLLAAESNQADWGPSLVRMEALLDARSGAVDDLQSDLRDRRLLNEIAGWLESYAEECLRMRIALDLLIVVHRGAQAMELVVAFCRFEGRLTHLGKNKKMSFGPRRVLYPQLESLEDTGARFSPDPALFLDRCLADDFVRFAERVAGVPIGVARAPDAAS